MQRNAEISYVYIYIYIHIHTYMCIYIYIYTYTYIRIHPGVTISYFKKRFRNKKLLEIRNLFDILLILRNWLIFVKTCTS